MDGKIEEILMAIRAQLEDIQARIKRMEDRIDPPVRVTTLPAYNPQTRTIPLTAHAPIPGWTKTDWDVT